MRTSSWSRSDALPQRVTTAVPSPLDEATRSPLAPRSESDTHGRPRPAEAVQRTPSPEGRAEAARAACDVLRASLDDARRATATSDELDADDAPARFDPLATELRRRYDHETRRNRDTAPAPAFGPRGDEPGFVVVTVLVGLDEDLDAMEGVTDHASLLRALDAVVPRRGGVAAMEVIWSPSTPDDRLSEHELATLYPELTALRDR